MKNSLETKLGIFVFLAILAAWAIVETLGGIDLFHKGYHVSAQFDTVQDLKVGDSVKMAGVEIGRVEKISLTASKVDVTMKLHPDAIVKTDSKATIKFTGLMGQNFVAVSFGSPTAPNGWTIWRGGLATARASPRALPLGHGISKDCGAAAGRSGGPWDTPF